MAQEIDLGRVRGQDALINGHPVATIVSGDNTEVINDAENKEIKINFLHNVHTFAFSVEVEDWINSDEHPNYPYQADVEIDGVEINDIGQLIFYPESVITASNSGVMSAANTFDGGITLYSQKKPTYSLSGNLIIVEKGWK